MSTITEILKVEGLSKHFDGLEVLKEVSFTVRSGEKAAVIGPNGAGKTTLFNVLGGQLQPSGGAIRLLEQDIRKLPPFRRLHLGLSRSYQINNLFDRLTLLDNMLLAFMGARHPHFRMLRRIDKRGPLHAEAQGLLDSLGLWDMRFQSLDSLSYGDQRLVEVAFGLASKPKLLMLDEPTAGLSTAEARTFGETIRNLMRNTTLLFTAHDMDLVFNLADRVMVLHAGKMIAEGNPEEIQSDPLVRKIYLGGEEGADDPGSG